MALLQCLVLKMKGSSLDLEMPPAERWEQKPLIASPVGLLHRVAARDSSFSGRGGKSDQKERRKKNHLLVHGGHGANSYS